MPTPAIKYSIRSSWVVTWCTILPPTHWSAARLASISAMRWCWSYPQPAWHADMQAWVLRGPIDAGSDADAFITFTVITTTPVRSRNPICVLFRCGDTMCDDCHFVRNVCCSPAVPVCQSLSVFLVSSFSVTVISFRLSFSVLGLLSVSKPFVSWFLFFAFLVPFETF